MSSSAVLQWFDEIGTLHLSHKLCTAAASWDQLDTLMWLREAGCDWRAFEVADAARTCRSIVEFVHAQGERFTPAQMTLLLSNAAVTAEDEAHLTCARWWREQGAEWPEILCAVLDTGDEFFDAEWEPVAVQWARSEGCTAPLLSEVANEADSDATDERNQDADG